MIPVRSMSSVTTQKDGLRFYKLVVVSTGNTVEFRVDKADAEASKTLLTQLMVGIHPAQAPAAPAAPQASAVLPAPAVEPSPALAPAPAPSSGQPDVLEQIAKLAALRDQGVLTEEEFSAKKADLLSRM